MSKITDEIRAQATEYYRGNDVCMANARRLLREVGLPNGLLPLQDVEECGYIESAPKEGFVWLKQKKDIEHNFKKINKLVRYATEVTAYVEECKIKKLTGVKAKELLWVMINEISVENRESDKIVFKNSATRISKTFPTSAFVVEEPEIKEEIKEKKQVVVATTGNGAAEEVEEEKKEAAVAATAGSESGPVAEEKKEADATKAANEVAVAKVVEV